MRLLLVFLTFFLTEYVLRTFVDSFKYHTVGLLFETVPLFILAIIFGTYFERTSETNKRLKTYIKLILISVFGLLLAKTVLFFQWYWIIAPEYRDIPGDMSVGLGWTILFSTINPLCILNNTNF